MKPSTPSVATAAAVTTAVCKYYGEDHDSLIGPRRHQPLVFHRQLAMALSYRLSRKSYPQIGDDFRRDHTTVIHAERIVATRAAIDPKLRHDIRALTEISINLTRAARARSAAGARFLFRYFDAAEAICSFLRGLAVADRGGRKPHAPQNGRMNHVD